MGRQWPSVADLTLRLGVFHSSISGLEALSPHVEPPGIRLDRANVDPVLGQRRVGEHAFTVWVGHAYRIAPDARPAIIPGMEDAE